ncbi:MAG: glycerophosphodiester phosphodiesterase [Bacillota bacterium]
MAKTRRSASWLILLTLLLTACTAGPAASGKREAAGTVEVVAHRGGFPENTLSAFRKAMATPGVGAIETDVQLTKDGVPVIMHDLSVDRTTNGNGLVIELTLAEIQALRTKESSEPVPTLEQVAELVAAHPTMRFLLEIKSPVPAEAPAKVLEIIRRHKIADRTVIMSFDAKIVAEVVRLAPDQQTCYLARQMTDEVLASPAQVLGMRFKDLTSAQVKEAQAKGKKVYAWTINQEIDMQTAMIMGVDGIISDQYAKAIDVRDGAKK